MVSRVSTFPVVASWEAVDAWPYGNPGIYTNVFPYVPKTFSFTFRTLNSSRSGSSVPGWRQKIAQGINATSDFSATLERGYIEPLMDHMRGTTVKGNYWWGYQRKTAGWWSFGLTSVPSAPSASLVNSVSNRAATAFYKKLASQLTLFQGATALGELAETLRMIKNPAKTLRKSVDDYLSTAEKRKRGPKRRLDKDLADTYLEYMFGWAPLIKDIDDARTYLDRRQEQLCNQLIPITAIASGSESSDVATGQNLNFVNAYARILTTKTVQHRYKGAIRTTVTGNPSFTAGSLGFAPKDFLPTAWELLPWSFVIDYFTNIGDVISAYSIGRMGLAWGCSTLRTESLSTVYGINTTLGIAEVMYRYTKNGSGWLYRKSVNRTSVNSVPLPEIQFELPGLGTKWLNLAALTTAKLATSKH